MNALIDLINDVLPARSPSGSNISTEVSKTLKDVGMIQALSCTLVFDECLKFECWTHQANFCICSDLENGVIVSIICMDSDTVSKLTCIY